MTDRPTPRRRRRVAQAIGAATVFSAILGSSSIAFAETKPAPKPSLLGGVSKLLTTTAGVLTDTLNVVTSPLGINLSLDHGLEFGAQNTGTPITRTDVRTAINSSGALRSGVNGTGVDVALIDTGVAPVPGIDGPGAVTNGPDLSLDHQAGLPASVDAFGHGTHLAGIIAGRDEGVAPGSRIVNVKAGAADGAVDVSQVIAAIDWVVAHRKDDGLNIRVLNLAYGTDSQQLYTSSPLTHAVESAWRNGIVVVVSSGNGGGKLISPAYDPFVLTVGAIDVNQPSRTTDDKLATYSSVGDASRPVDVVAPGTSIESLRVPGSTVDTNYPESRSADGTETRGSGTSQAAAVTSGAVALLLQQRPNLTPDQVKALLKSTAHPLTRTAATAQGSGVIDVGRALLTAPAGPAAAAQKFTPSTGTGPIEGARGTAHLTADDGTVLQGEVDIQGAPWVGSTWAPASSAGTAWTGGTWNGNVWAGTTWEPTSGVDGVTWNGRSWRSEAWSGRSWRADLWAGRSWRGESWEGRSWRGRSWR